MHELGIAQSVLDAVRTEVALRPGAVPVAVGIRIGDLAGIDADALAFGFEALTAGTRWQSLKLEVEKKPRSHRCTACSATFNVADYNFTCPSCGSLRTEFAGGDELELTYVELEEP